MLSHLPWGFQILAALACTTFLGGLITLVWLFFRIMAKIGELSLKTDRIKELAAVVSGLNERIGILEGQSRDQTEWVSQVKSINLNRRGQVLRLHRRGDSVSEIASALRLRAGEVSLMIKVHELVSPPVN